MRALVCPEGAPVTATALAVAGVLWRRLRRDRVGLAFTWRLHHIAGHA
jgi:hypothetical protein